MRDVQDGGRVNRERYRRRRDSKRIPHVLEFGR